METIEPAVPSNRVLEALPKKLLAQVRKNGWAGKARSMSAIGSYYEKNGRPKPCDDYSAWAVHEILGIGNTRALSENAQIDTEAGLEPQTTRERMERVFTGRTSETWSDRCALLHCEAYAIANTLRLTEAALDSEAGEHLVRSRHIQAEMTDLESRITLIGEELERLGTEIKAKESPTN